MLKHIYYLFKILHSTNKQTNKQTNFVAFRRMVSFGMLRRVALVRTDVSEELRAAFIRVTRIGELGTTLALPSNRRLVFLRILRRLLVTAKVIPSSPILVTLMKEALSRFLQESHGVISQKTPFFLITAVKTSNLTFLNFYGGNPRKWIGTQRKASSFHYQVPQKWRGNKRQQRWLICNFIPSWGVFYLLRLCQELKTDHGYRIKQNQTPCPLVRKWTLPTERPALVDEI
jgi:hypothetical protein